MSGGFVPLDHQRLTDDEAAARSHAFLALMRKRRTVRHFARDVPPRMLVENAIAAAGTAPSGAHQQPWTFVVVTDPQLKARIREAAEAEERAFYRGRAPDEWLEALAPLGTDEHKAHLTDAPYLVVVFEQAYGLEDGRKRKHYYVRESVGIAVGVLLAALHTAGLASLTHTPSPMAFLCELLERPQNERAFLLVACGYPAAGAVVPDLRRKELGEIAIFR